MRRWPPGEAALRDDDLAIVAATCGVDGLRLRVGDPFPSGYAERLADLWVCLSIAQSSAAQAWWQHLSDPLRPCETPHSGNP